MLIAIARNGFFGDVPADSVVDTDADSVVYDAEGNLAARVTDAGEYRFALSDGQAFTAVIGGAPEAFELDQWTMVLESWTANDSSREALKTQMGPYELEELIPWNEIEGLETAAGIATYETTFYLEEGWEDGLGAMVDFGYVSDTMKVWVNGEKVSGVDMIANQADIGPYLVKGKNTITVEVASTLGNSKSKMTFEYGLVGPVVVTPYRQAVLTIPETEPVKSASAPESVQVA